MHASLFYVKSSLPFAVNVTLFSFKLANHLSPVCLRPPCLFHLPSHHGYIGIATPWYILPEVIIDVHASSDYHFIEIKVTFWVFVKLHCSPCGLVLQICSLYFIPSPSTGFESDFVTCGGYLWRKSLSMPWAFPERNKNNWFHGIILILRIVRWPVNLLCELKENRKKKVLNPPSLSVSFSVFVWQQMQGTVLTSEIIKQILHPVVHDHFKSSDVPESTLGKLCRPKSRGISVVCIDWSLFQDEVDGKCFEEQYHHNTKLCKCSLLSNICPFTQMFWSYLTIGPYVKASA